MQLNFNTDTETQQLIDTLIVRYLQKYFSQTIYQAYSAVNNYYSSFSFKNTHPDFYDEQEELNLLFHHEHPYLVAERIYFEHSEELKKQYSNVVEWQLSKGGFNVPAEAEKDWQIWSAD